MNAECANPWNPDDGPRPISIKETTLAKTAIGEDYTMRAKHTVG